MFRLFARSVAIFAFASHLSRVDSFATLPVYVLAGQSNMVGNGNNAELPALYDEPTESVIRTWGTVSATWTNVRPGLGSNERAFGPELGFARAMPQRIAIVKVAISASDLAVQWRSPSRCDAPAGTPGPAFTLLVDAVREALAGLRDAGESPSLAGVGWIQGESDAFREETALDYAGNLLGFVQDLRTALGAPSLPFAIARVPISDAMPHAATVAAAQDLVGRLLPCVAVIPIDDLGTYDGLHYESIGYLELGVRMAGALDRAPVARGDPSMRIVNVSARGVTGCDERSLILGFVPQGGTLPLLVRGIGPGLVRAGLPAAENPHLFLYKDGKQSAETTPRRADPAVAWAAYRSGAADPETVEDVALLRALPVGAYTTHLASENGGVALMELFDCGLETGDPARLGNVSARAWVRTGDERLVFGFVVAGPAHAAPARVLLRAAGPALARFGVASHLPNPVVELYRDGILVASNDDWHPSLAAIIEGAGAADFEPGSADAALALSLAPGAYTAHVFDATGAEGVVLTELYRLEDDAP
ncbi:hypothetical protein ASA1KI_25840 [Opitutales bacterium ASA1]|uniref:sialate O-acetylesterase n=1 Tax=Congregicoccus parvus TaxID=3081749 RepID=UPI002B2D5174|nr:hypothetical protein ASA1KI_25840 [Opitutales bacterium ASA1]